MRRREEVSASKIRHSRNQTRHPGSPFENQPDRVQRRFAPRPSHLCQPRPMTRTGQKPSPAPPSPPTAMTRTGCGPIQWPHLPAALPCSSLGRKPSDEPFPQALPLNFGRARLGNQGTAKELPGLAPIFSSRQSSTGVPIVSMQPARREECGSSVALRRGSPMQWSFRPNLDCLITETSGPEDTVARALRTRGICYRNRAQTKGS